MESNPSEVIERLSKEIDRLRIPATSSASTINLNAGGIGVYIACTCCAVMLAVNILLVAIIVDHSRKLDRLNDYVTATYMISGSKK